jgi:methylmalonyl-CoA mutase
MNFFMEVAKMRAARLLWARLVKDQGATNPKSLSLRTHSQTSGWSLTAQDVFNNVVRTCIEAMASTQGHTQSLHTNALDEAIALPTDFSARIARNTQLVLQQESGTTRVIDPWAGSAYVERLTHDLARRAWEHIEEVEAAGGMAKAIEAGIPKMRIEEAAARTQARIDSGQQPVIGVNRYPVDEDEPIEVLKVDNAAVRASQVAKLERLRAERDEDATRAALAKITDAAALGFGWHARDEPARPGDRCCPRQGDGRGDVGGDGGGLRPLHRADPYDRWRVQRRGRAGRERVCEAQAARRGVRGEPRAAARASSSPRWARTATTAARRSSRPPSPTSASTSTWARCSRRPAEVARQAVEADVHVVGVSPRSRPGTSRSCRRCATSSTPWAVRT